MRAKVIGVVLVTAGLFGAVGMTSPASQLASRGHHDHHDGHGGDRCVAEREVLIGPVCVTVNDVLSDILTT
jgi:hypothetical protein